MIWSGLYLANTYKKSIRRANREHWEDMCTKVEGVQACSRIHRIGSFGPYKSPGIYGIWPIFLQKVQERITIPLVDIFKACIAYMDIHAKILEKRKGN